MREYGFSQARHTVVSFNRSYNAHYEHLCLTIGTVTVDLVHHLEASSRLQNNSI